MFSSWVVFPVCEVLDSMQDSGGLGGRLTVMGSGQISPLSTLLILQAFTVKYYDITYNQLYI